MREEQSLYKAFEDCFPIGAAVSPATAASHAALLSRHFNSITAENSMKPESLHPEEDRWDFAEADGLVAFARQNRMKVRGHTLVWHSQTPDWFFKDKQGGPASRDILLGRMKEHITEVVRHFKGDAYCWDVVNEAVQDRPGGFLRDTRWLKLAGPDYIRKAFEYAHEADPDAVLFYNDYNESDPEKCGKIIRLVQGLLEEGAPIHGIGLQAHWSIGIPSVDTIRAAIERYATLGLKLQITELDVSLYAPGDERTDLEEPTSAMLEAQAEYYERIFRLFREYREHISGVTFWGAADDATWLRNFPVRGRVNAPLLFDARQRPKAAYFRVLDAARTL